MADLRDELRRLKEEKVALKELLAKERRRRWRAERERDEWRRSAEMACQEPPEGCECPGCTLADERMKGGE